ncbi:MAG: hypothetical protein L6R39_002449 [Caloplaca ligustica]|nr:MAG: hypothetical protein L6R39_002449 [Caloplaca ligustica]
MSFRDVQSAIHFLKENPSYQHEKPYAFRFALSSNDIPQSNMEMQKVEPITITDIRGFEQDYSLDVNGFTILELDSKLGYHDFYDSERVKVYFAELEDLLEYHLGASKVKVFRHGLRKRHPTFPISTGEAYHYDQPTSVAHIDTTPTEEAEEVRRQYGAEASDLLNRHSQWINIWKPLKGPLNDWPLTVCDASTVQSKGDLEAADLLYPDLMTENYQVYARSYYKWYYLSDHLPSELMVFKQADSRSGSGPGVPHCSFYNPLVPDGEEPRESIEARALVFYDD